MNEKEIRIIASLLFLLNKVNTAFSDDLIRALAILT